MVKNILIISSSPRRGGNSDTLCNEFLRGAQEAGNTVEKIFLADKNIHFCNGCDLCSSTGKPCPQKDDAAEVIEKMVQADVLVLATPVYFYAMSAQLKTLLDRCCGRYTEIGNKDFYLLASAAENGGERVQHVFDNIQGFLDCLENPTVKGKLLCGGVWHKGEIKGNPALKEAYEMGKSV
jgi:multimeric flavodoxin WrbA